MAEILLSLTIIGVVAAITLPSLTGNINERTWNTQRKTLYSRMSQAVALMPSMRGYGTYDETTDTAAETFVTSGLAKVLKINNICDGDHLADCGIASSAIAIGGSKVTMPTTMGELNSRFNVDYNYNKAGYSKNNSKAAAFETANGESILAFYNTKCSFAKQNPTFSSSETWTRMDFIPQHICANFIYDLNGKKGPNTIGKDMGFITVFYPTDSVVVAPMPRAGYFFKNAVTNAAASCRKKYGDEFRVPNKEETAALWANLMFLESPSSYDHAAFSTSSTFINADGRELIWMVIKTLGWYEVHQALDDSYIGMVQCIYR